MTDKASGETVFAQSHGNDLPGGYAEEGHDFVRLSRAPGEFDRFAGGKLVTDKARRDRAALRRRPLEDRVAKLETLVA